MPGKVLHVVANLDRCAVEKWLVRMLRHARRRCVDVDWTFYCTLGRPGLMDDEVRALGARVIYSPVPLGRKLAFIRALRNELRNGKYDALHCHHDLVSAIYLLGALGVPIDRKIVHVHNADEAVPTPNIFKQWMMRPLLRCVCLALADRIVGNSNHSLDTFLAGRARRPGRDVVHYYGVDPTPWINDTCGCARFRSELGLRDDALILLFAGRMVTEKNPVFVIDVLADLRRLEPRAVAVFAGAGSLESSVRDRAIELGVESAVRMLGWRSDVPEIMSCSDWFILPHPEHPMEGFGLAVVEAQLAGLPMLLSKGVASDPLFPTASFCHLSLSDTPKVWAKAAIDLFNSPKGSSTAVLASLRESPMDMDQSLNNFLKLCE